MAKWGEGDPRWIVEERPDATNVNNWHWTEKDATGWSQEKLKDLLIGMRMENDIVDCWIVEADKVEGEASASNRKAKLIFFYEWDITLSWKGRLKDGNGEAEGKINIPNLSEENDVNEVEVNVSLKSNSLIGDILKDFINHQGKEKIQEKLGLYVKLLKEEFSKGMILPRKSGEEAKNNTKTPTTKPSIAQNKVVNSESQSSQPKKTSTNLETSVLKNRHTFQCRGDEFFRAFLTKELVEAFTHGKVVLDPRIGGRFELFGGNVVGEFVDIVPDKKIVQKWRLNRWPENHYSSVTLKIDQKSDCTEVELEQTGVPKGELDVTRENWDRYYWDSIKRTFGWGIFV